MKSDHLIKNIFLHVIFILSIISCNTNREAKKVDMKPVAKDLTELNRYLVQKDREIIENYIERKNLDMTESPTGLWYLVKNEGSGGFLADNDKIAMNYECALLDGTQCYSSDILGPKEIILGKTKLEPGLDEGLRFLKPGAEAVFILPPFLAYGLIGDGNKIPPRATIIYSVKILPLE
jgi:FKBP-type peptidyl-prolyl cis-trans isomerase FkpA